MKNDTKTHFWRDIIGILVGTLFFWLVGYLFIRFGGDKLNLWFDTSIMAPEEATTLGYENLFAPVAAFFGGLSAMATAYLIYRQMQSEEEHQKDVRRNIFENQLNQMFLMKNELIKSLEIEEKISIKKSELRSLMHTDEDCIQKSIPIFDILRLFVENSSTNKDNADEISNENESDSEVIYPATYKKNDVFTFFYKLLYYGLSELFQEDVNRQHICVNILSIEKEILKNVYRNKIDNLKKDLKFHLLDKVKYSVKEIEEYINMHYNNILSPFYHNVYTTLKMIASNNEIPNEEKNNYMRMFRSQFTQQEFILIYFHALNQKEEKFKKLIEETCFFHSILESSTILDINFNKYNWGYKKTAFQHKYDLDDWIPDFILGNITFLQNKCSFDEFYHSFRYWYNQQTQEDLSFSKKKILQYLRESKILKIQSKFSFNLKLGFKRLELELPKG